MAQYRKKPVVVDAYQITDSFLDGVIFDKVEYPKGLSHCSSTFHPRDRYITEWTGKVVTIHGQETRVIKGDWIIAEPDGEHFYPCKPDIFEKTYELVTD